MYIYVVLCLFTIMVYATSGELGSPSKVYDNLTTMALPGNFPVAYNLDGSYLTMWSRGGLIFGIINIIGAPYALKPYSLEQPHGYSCQPQIQWSHTGYTLCPYTPYNPWR